MANYCTNLFFASTENEQDLNMIEKYLDEHFETYLEVYEDTLDGEFTSRWTFPCESIDEMMKNIQEPNKLYIRILSNELQCEYVSFRTFSQGKWNIHY
jgi:hypothetical protein